MNSMSKLLQEQFGATLADNFVKRATYYSVMDSLEYVCKDTTTVADRVDGFLTVLLDAYTLEVIGFKLKGFGFVFNKYVKELMKLRDGDFNPIIEALECAFTQVGDDMFKHVDTENDRRVQAYRATLDMIKREELELPVEFSNAA